MHVYMDKAFPYAHKFWPLWPWLEVMICVQVSKSAFRFRKMVITFAILIIATWYLACMCISWSCTFWVVKGQCQGHPSRSKVKYMWSKSLILCKLLQYFNIQDSNLIFGMHVYLMELHIWSGERSRSSFKVKGQKTLFFWGGFHVYLIDLHIWSGEKVKVNDDLQGQR